MTELEPKKDILIRTYLVFIWLSVLCLAIVGKVLYIQLANGESLREMASEARVKVEEIEAERGSIFSEDGSVLSTSVPEFDIYIDFKANGLIEKDGKLFRDNLDSLSMGLAHLFKDKKSSEYKKRLQQGFKKGERYALLKRKISYTEYESLKKLPLVRLGRNSSGFIAEVRMKRLYPFKNLANRTVGIARDSNNVGLERSYDQYLSGIEGRRLVRYIAGGTAVPVEDGLNADPIDGSDIRTTLDAGIQDIAHQALEKMMVENEAIHGTCIVLEVKTGKVRAIANLGRQSDGTYWEDYNYALAGSEPGSTWKLTTLMAVLEDQKVTLKSTVNLEGGKWNVAGLTVYDSEIHGMHEATVQQAFEKSSNVGMAKLANGFYSSQPSKYIDYIHKWHMDTLTGIDLPGETRPVIYKPGTRRWNKSTLPWMGFGYNLSITPMHTAMLYNSVANGGKMVKPYLIDAILKDGEVIKQFQPTILSNSICSPKTLLQVKECLEGVVLRGTAYKLQTDQYSFAGKTGTSLVADKGISYADKMYQASFAGYFPADNPQYTIVVVIRNKAHAPRFYGGLVAGPVFREVSDRLFAGYIKQNKSLPKQKTDSVNYLFAGIPATLHVISSGLKIPFYDSSKGSGIGYFTLKGEHPGILYGERNSKSDIPDLTGFGLKDALKYCEENGWAVSVKGKGKVINQSILPVSQLNRSPKILLELN